VVASLLAPREIHFLGPSRRIWRGGPLIGRFGDATVEVMIPVGCEPTRRDTALGHHIQGCVGSSSVEQWSTGGHGDAWWCVVVCWIVLQSGNASQCSEYMQGVTGAMT